MIYINIDMFETTEGNTYCCNFCKCVEENKHTFKNKVLMNRSHKCRIVDILTETLYIEVYERMRNNHIEKHMINIWKMKMILSLGIKKK